MPDHPTREHVHSFADVSGECSVCGTHYRHYIGQLRNQLRAERRQSAQGAVRARQQHEADQAQIVRLQDEHEQLLDVVKDLAAESPDWQSGVALHREAVRTLRTLGELAEEEEEDAND